jgi:hypothetical protein
MPDRAARSPTEERKNVEKALRDAKGAVVVLIDEFDRLEPAEMKAMGQAIKAAMDLPNISWVIALDSERVTHVLRGEDRDWALGFIAKVITVNIPLRPLTDDEKARLLEQYLTEAGVGEPILQSELYPVVRGHLLPVLRTPRDIKRTVATYATMYRMVGWAVFSCDVLGWAALGAIRPDLQRKVSENLGDLCFGGERTANVLEQIFGEDNEQRAWEENVGIQGKDSIRGLLEFLFPKNSTPTYSHIYGRIQFYPNAWNLLWLGNGPFTWSVDQIKHLWSEPERFVSEEVERSDNISNLLEDTFRLLPDLDPKGDLAFMHFAIGRCKASNLAVRDLTEHFLRQVNRDPDLKARMRAVFGQLRAKDDLVLVPALVRGQAGRHGLRGHKANKTEPEFLSAEEVEAVLGQEVPKWREWVTSGEWLKPPYLRELLWAYVHLEGLAGEVQQSVLTQLNTLEKVSHFARLVVQEHWGVNAESLRKIVPLEEVVGLVTPFVSASQGEDRERLEALLVAASGHSSAD